MKKLFLIVCIIGSSFFVGCESEEENGKIKTSLSDSLLFASRK
ncbi:MAG: hypothetical protein PHG27_04125 [Massilibacteroides sp.]|nr:hypothetical protein [Massilibacteroides sp.]